MPRHLIIRILLFLALALAVSACGSDADIQSAEQRVAAARAQLAQDQESGNQGRIASDHAQLDGAQRDLSYLRLNWYGPRDRGW